MSSLASRTAGVSRYNPFFENVTWNSILHDPCNRPCSSEGAFADSQVIFTKPENHYKRKEMMIKPEKKKKIMLQCTVTTGDCH